MILGTAFEIFGFLTSSAPLEDLSGDKKLGVGTMAAQRRGGRCLEEPLLPAAERSERAARARDRERAPGGCRGAGGLTKALLPRGAHGLVPAPTVEGSSFPIPSLSCPSSHRLELVDLSTC